MTFTQPWVHSGIYAESILVTRILRVQKRRPSWCINAGKGVVQCIIKRNTLPLYCFTA
jgi:hypothetical protein